MLKNVKTKEEDKWRIKWSYGDKEGDQIERKLLLSKIVSTRAEDIK